ncbi:MAG: energy-coupling factor transporter transmembrane protein EcfT [Lachnospiraceae bacterium]|nr:energy-coupling factor transporter transmembrane protein EcfT [Lachnospiraceae bacterium]
MITDITLGQFFPGQSVIHRLDPRTKILGAIFYIVIVFLAKNVFSFLLLVAFTLFLVLLSRISPKVVLKGLKPLIIIIVFTAILNLFGKKGETPLISFWIINIYPEGIRYAIMIIIRVVCMLAGTSVILSYTTSPTAITEGIERLLSPLAVLHLPVHDFAMMMTIALRFIPTLIDETDKIMKAQTARGVDFSSGSLIRRAKALIPILIPLLFSAFRHAKDLSIAMECRCYRAGKGMTHMTTHRFGLRDYLSALVMCAFCAAVVLLNKYAPGFSL